ncbi:hypothetical protein DRF65_10895 [Chryseobacterium pennae]|uniref:Uncharacterized protein n=1 Tax=Chryseobacterium pennae TaxID=2258962 RepID=A0A3D9C8M6_9FLAO|nr:MULTISPECIES: hypothetical protein [Chryseobacterium]MCS4304936.1 putative heme iron utilization protein [Chryseobacterium sp. BIGb0232]REC62217.1 hypothetical protein DRF65_10895 [Chryseobacterium pennae]ROS09644.1 hypothetical protein EDF65_4383 [Chryseobacterium nakagawai]
MRSHDFYKIYLPALEKALQNDEVNEGFYVKGPEDYINQESIEEATRYLEENEDEFLEKVAYYFDAKSHNFPSIQGVDIEVYKEQIKSCISKLKY